MLFLIRQGTSVLIAIFLFTIHFSIHTFFFNPRLTAFLSLVLNQFGISGPLVMASIAVD